MTTAAPHAETHDAINARQGRALDQLTEDARRSYESDANPGTGARSLDQLLEDARRRADAATRADRVELASILDRSHDPRDEDGERARELALSLGIDPSALRELATLAAEQHRQRQESESAVRDLERDRADLQEQIAHRRRELAAMATLNANVKAMQPVLMAALVGAFRDDAEKGRRLENLYLISRGWRPVAQGSWEDTSDARNDRGSVPAPSALRTQLRRDVAPVIDLAEFLRGSVEPQGMPLRL
jgi:hypothetical protein